ncbi:uncharacterized protein CCOS01_01321 [Colletotrichum costaricense]|uniref:Uncharacterized protein n=1 Tax=Colletotrichum costaricense TaxID=1209916 RepID=A0AAI9ZCK0_9PEZI|nr:uncharacterized protein CCOS01_01321 [Colletotrichum costaricense]KAK1540007.1 hypothetical protein CCOS01_01321 [Colletotrichum costaricense]
MLVKVQPGASIWHLKLPSQQGGMPGSGRFPKRSEHQPEAMGLRGSFVYEGDSKGAEEEEKQRGSTEYVYSGPQGECDAIPPVGERPGSPGY